MSKSSKAKKGKTAERRNLRVIYPEYFDKNLTWRMGRRVPTKLAFDAPELKRVAKKKKKAGYETFLDSEKHYSKTWYDQRGRVLITKDGSKEEQIREIARNLSKVNVPKTKAKKPVDKKKKVKKGSVYRQKTR
ncbi:MAG: signal recognition particle subunit SRP19/SEC65 family protein [Candidatus Heimdallarchaeota archaeon]